MEEAALDYKPQTMEKLLALTLKAAKDLHRANCKALITFKSPKHGSVKSNAQVQAILRTCCWCVTQRMWASWLNLQLPSAGWHLRYQPDYLKAREAAYSDARQ